MERKIRLTKREQALLDFGATMLARPIMPQPCAGMRYSGAETTRALLDARPNRYFWWYAAPAISCEMNGRRIWGYPDDKNGFVDCPFGATGDILTDGTRRLTVEAVDTWHVQRIEAAMCLELGIDLSAIPGIGSDSSIITAYSKEWDAAYAKKGFAWASNPWAWLVRVK